MQEQIEKQPNLLDNLYTPKQIADRGILSLVTQWKERDQKRLKFYQSGRKILYSEAHIKDYLALCEEEAAQKIDQKIQSRITASQQTVKSL